MRQSVAFIHLDLGIGGAENLVVNAAKGLKDLGCSVKMYTSHHDRSRAFRETTDGTLDVKVYGNWIPRQLFGRFTILMSTIRMVWICIMMWVNRERADVVFTDQVSATNVAVRVLGLAKRRLVFYCHYPDVLLCVDRKNLFKRIYRLPFDWLERYTTSVCDVLLVNSEFTAETLRATFENVKRKVEVLYPPIDTDSIKPGVDCTELHSLIGNATSFVSLNRYERKKDLPLVIEAFADFNRVTNHKDMKLVHAGGYDPRLTENVVLFKELEDQIRRLSLEKNVILLKNVSDSLRSALLEKAEAVIYSPQFEHFGIVPCEAMAVGTPVIAWNNGGPKESVLNNKTGWLCSDRSGFSKAMVSAVHRDENKRSEMSKACRDRVVKKFSLAAFSKNLASLIEAK